MAQRPTADFNIDPNITSGTDLANILNRFQDAIDSGNSGASRPAYLAAGGLWVREGDPMRLYLYDGTTDRELYNTTDGIVGALEDGTVDGQITTWDESTGAWTPEDAVVVDANGNVGIGTDNPVAPLEVQRTGGVAAAIIGSNQTGCELRFEDNGTTLRPAIGSKGNDLVGLTGNIERMRIDADGNVGIGVDTTSYSNKLVVDQGGNYAGAHETAAILVRDSTGTISDGSHHGAISFSKGTGQASISAVQTGSSVNNLGLAFWTHASDTGTYPAIERMRIDSSGRVGIGGTPGTRSTKEIEDEAESTLANWKSQLDERLKAEPKADKKAVTQEITGYDKMPTKAELVERLTERTIGGGNAKLQVAGDGYFSGTVSAGHQFSVNSVGFIRGEVPGELRIQSGTSKISFWNHWYNQELGFIAGDGSGASFSGTVNANAFVDATGPLTSTLDLIETFRTLKAAVSDETTVEGIKEALTNSLGGLIEKFEAMQSPATQEIES